MKVRVDQERCQGHTLCALTAPQVFQLNDVDGHSTPVGDEVPADQTEAAREAVLSCPERAISIL